MCLTLAHKWALGNQDGARGYKHHVPMALKLFAKLEQLAEAFFLEKLHALIEAFREADRLATAFLLQIFMNNMT